MHDHSNEPSLRVLGILHRLEMPALAAVAVVASTVLVLWLIPPVDVYAPAVWSKMSVRSVASEAAALALAVLAVGVGALGIYATGLEPPEARWLQLPAPQTTTCFVLIGLGASLINRTRGTWSRVADLSVVILIGFVLFLFAGYVFRVDAFAGISPSNVTCRRSRPSR